MPDDALNPKIPRRRRPSADAADPVYELDLWLDGSEPLIWRTVAVPAEVTLATMHRVIQRLMAWHDAHLHAFRCRSGRSFEPPRPGGAVDSMWATFRPESEPEDESAVTLRDVFDELKEILVYEYDFGDSWYHGIKVIATHADESAFDQLPVCLAGGGAGPPEDSGGVWGYAEKLEILRDPDPDDSWHQEVIEWMGGRDFDPSAFDLVAKNRALARIGRSRGGG